MAFEFDASTAKAEGTFDPSTATLEKPSGALRRVADQGIKLAQGVVGVPEAAVGVADLVTGGQAGKLVENAGVRFKDAKNVLGEYLSPEQKAADQEVAQAEGFLPTLGAMVKNPSTIIGATVESAPSMLMGGAASRGLLAVAPKIGAIAAGAAGEGITAAGQNAEQVRQEDPNGTLTGEQSAILAGSGALTGLISGGAGKIANKLGIGDVQTMLAKGKLGVVGAEAEAAAAKKGLARKIGEGFASEGVLQELPQSYQEQVAQNIAQGKPWDEGAAKAGAQGMMAGALMGGGANAAAHFAQDKETPPPAPVEPPAQPGTPTQDPAQLGYNPSAGTHTVFPDGSVVLNSESSNGAQTVRDMQRANRLANVGQDVTDIEPNPIRDQVAQAAAQGGALSGAALVALDTGVHQAHIDQQTSEADQAAYDAHMAEQDTTDKPITHGEYAEAQMPPADLEAMLMPNEDIHNGDGFPYTSEAAAQRRAKMEGKLWEVAPTDGGWKLQKTKETPTKQANLDRIRKANNVSPTSPVQPIPATSGGQDGNQSTASVGSGGSDANGLGANAAGSQPSGVGRAGEHAGGVPASPVAKGRAQPTTLGTQTSAKAGPGFSAKDVPSVKNPAPAANDTQAKATPDQAPQAVAGDAATAGKLPGAGSATVEGGGVGQTETFSLDTHGWNAGKLADSYDMGQLNKLWQEVQPQFANRLVEGSPVDDRGMATKHRLNPAGQKIEASLKKAIQIVYDRKKTEDSAANRAKLKAKNTPTVKDSSTVQPVSQPPKEPNGTQADKAQPQQTKQQEAPAATGVEVSRFNGKFKKGMNKGAAHLEAIRLNKTNDGITYTAEEHNDPALENPYAVVGRKAAQVAQIAQTSVQPSVQSDATEQKPVLAPAEHDEVATETIAKPAKTKKPAGGKSLRATAYDRNPLLTFLATHGLFHDKDKPNSHKAEFSPDKGIMVMGYGPIFKKTGKRLDVLTHTAIEEGYLPKDGTESQLRELVRRAIAGEKISPVYAQGVAEQLAEQSYAEHLAQQQEAAQDEDFDPFQSLSELGYEIEDALSAGRSDITIALQNEVDALLFQAEDAGIDIDQIKADAATETDKGSQDDYLSATKQKLQSAIASRATDGNGGNIAQDGGEGRGGTTVSTSNRDSGQNDDLQAQPAEQEGLTLSAPTRRDVIAQQDALEAEAKRKEDGGDKPINRQQLTGDVPDMFNTQGSVFDVPAEPTDPFSIADTRSRRKAVLEILGDGWTASDGIEGSRDLFKKTVGSVQISIMAQKTVDGNFYVGSYDSATKRGSNTSEPKTLEQAKTAAESFISKAQPAAQEPSNGKSPIGDFGQKIGGAKKDTWTGFKDDLSSIGDDDIASRKLSEIWPSPDYQKLIDDGMDARAVASIRALRDEIPSKPRTAYKVKRWAEQVKAMRELASNILAGSEIGLQLERGTSQMRGIAGRVDLYMAVGHSKSLEGIRLAHHHYSLYKGRENVSMWVAERDSAATAFSNFPQELAIGDTKEQAIAAFKAKYETLDATAAVKKAEFVIYTQDGKFFVGKKIGRNTAEMAGPFATVKEARSYRESNLAELEAKLEKYKEIPKERRDTNEPRVGEDMRNGQDVTPEMFSESFGFKGVEFGNWVEQKRRQKDLNDAFDALMDMAAILEIPAKAISLNGELGLAFGARGSGGVNPAAAHYEPGKIVINLTKREGAGSLGHEWWHALDNYFSRMRSNRTSSYMTTATDVSLSSKGSNYVAYDGVRKEMIDAFGEVVKSIRLTAMKARSTKIDAKRTKEYWTTGEEMAARAFESYLISKLHDQDASNDYLANVVDQKTWDAMAALGMENEDSYPYPTAGEMPVIRAGFDNFFQTLETKETDTGVALFNIRNGDADPVEAAKVQSGIEGKGLIEAAQFIIDSGREPDAAVARKVVDKLRLLQEAGFKLGLKIVHRGDMIPSELFTARGHTEFAMDEKGSEIIVWLNGADIEGKVGTEYEVLLHELVHAVTSVSIRYGVQNQDTEVGRSVKDLTNVSRAIAHHIVNRFDAADAGKVELTKFEQDMRTGANNAMHNPDEVVAWALTSREAQQYLEAIPYKGQTLWSRFVQVVRSFLGLSPDSDTALSEVLRVSEKLMDIDPSMHGIKAFWHKRNIRMTQQQAMNSLVSRSDRGADPVFSTTQPVVFSQGQQVPQAQRLTKQAVEKILDGIRSRFPSLPPVLIENSVLDAFGSRVPAGTTAKGASNGKEVFVFLDSHSSELDVLRTIFHELFHHGLSKTLPQAQYISTMLKLLSDKQVSQYAKNWRESKEGVMRKGEMPVNNWMALSVEEALADIAEEINTGAKTGLRHSFMIRRIAAWAADLADMLGLSKLATAIRGATLTEAQKYVQDMVKAAGEAGGTKQLRDARYSGIDRGNQGGRSADDSTPGASFDAQAAFEKHGGTGDVDESTDITAKSNAFADMAEAEGYEVAGRGDKYVTITKSYGKNADGYDVDAIIKVRVSDHSNVNRGRYFGDSDINLAPDDGYSRDTFVDALRKIKSAYVNDDLDTVIPNESTAPDGGGVRFRIADTLASAINDRETKIVGQTNRQYTPAQLAAMKSVGFQVELPSLKERAQALWKDAGKKMAQGIVDQFAPVKALDGTAYGLLRLAKGASGAFESFLRGGKLRLTDGVYDFDEKNKGGVVDRLLTPLQGEHHDFMRWVAANRAERLHGEGKENLFSKQDVADLKTLSDGTTQFDYKIQTGPKAGTVTRNRSLIYEDANRIFNEFNKNILDMAEQSGLIDGESRKVWEHEFYVPFYRVADEDGGGVRGMNIKGSVLRQQAFKELKGGKNALNADLLDNTLMNWAHLLDASAKNRAAKATIEAAEKMGIATGGNQSTLASMGASIHNKNGVVWFMDGGHKRYSLIDNKGDGPYLMTAINALEYAGMRNPVMNAMGTMKHVLTIGVTASPFFKIRNLIRDSVQVIGTSKINPNIAVNLKEGWKLTDPKSDAYFRLLAGGGTIHFGTMMEGSESKRVQALVESGVDDSTILGDEHKVKAFYRKYIEPGITAYNELGNRGEAINRASLYDQLRKQGMNHADASLQARDLMDFSMQGSFTSIRFLTQVVPFLNARIQGLYKLGRAAKEDPARFGAVLGATALFSLALLAAYSDDDDWKKREDWDRNNFWWFKFGGTAFRIPKPFEVGAIATLAERGFELAFDKEMTDKRFMAQVLTLLGDNLSMNPIPQLVKPILDVYANKDSFSGRPIETMGMDRLKSDYRFTDRTSMTARAASTGLNAVTGLVGAEALSPVQIDHMLRGYFGWLGSFVVGAGDVIARPATSQAVHPSSDMFKVGTGGMVSDLRDAPSRYVSQMYTQAKEIEKAYGTWKALQKEGKILEASEFAQEHKGELSKYHQIERVKRNEASANQRIRMVERSNMDADKKRELIRQIQLTKDQLARGVAA